MKHIFTVHSPVTFLCAYSVCKTLNLAESDVIIISASYNPPFKFGEIVVPFHEKKKKLFDKVVDLNLPRAYDKYIDSLSGGSSFIAYIDLMHYWQRLLVTNAKCEKFNFLEEGMSSYLKPDTLLELTFAAKEKSFRNTSFKEYLISVYFALRSYNHRLLNLPYWAYEYKFLNDVGYYCFSDLCYPGIDKKYKKVVPFIGKTNEGMTLKNKIVWIEDIYNKRHVSNEKNITTAIEKAINYIQNKYGKTHGHLVKLRPNGTNSSSEVIPILEKKGLHYSCIDAKEPLELIMQRSSNLILVSATSSLLFYGKVMGHQAYTYFRLLKERRHSAFEGMNFYWNFVDHIHEDNSQNLVDEKKD